VKRKHMSLSMMMVALVMGGLLWGAPRVHAQTVVTPLPRPLFPGLRYKFCPRHKAHLCDPILPALSGLPVPPSPGVLPGLPVPPSPGVLPGLPVPPGP